MEELLRAGMRFLTEYRRHKDISDSMPVVVRPSYKMIEIEMGNLYIRVDDLDDREEIVAVDVLCEKVIGYTVAHKGGRSIGIYIGRLRQ